MTDFHTFIQTERASLLKKKEELHSQMKDLTDALAGVDRELRAIDAYEAARKGKPTKSAGSQKDKVIAAIKAEPGLKPKDIAERLGDTVPKSAVHNILSALKKAGKVTVTEGTYALS